MEINFDNPILVFYVNISGLPRQSAEEKVSQARTLLSVYSNLVSFVVPVNDRESKMEYLQKNTCCHSNNKHNDIIVEIESYINDINLNAGDFKSKIRDLIISKL